MVSGLFLGHLGVNIGNMSLTFGTDVGARIRFARQASQLTQEGLSLLLKDKGIHLDRGQITKIEIGARQLKPTEIAWIAHVLNLSTDQLLGLKDMTLTVSYLITQDS